MELFGMTIPAFGVSSLIASMLAIVLGVRIVASWRHRSFPEEAHPPFAATLMLGYACLYSGLAVMAIYVLLGGLLPYELMDRFVTLLMSAGDIALVATLLVATAGNELTKDQARDAFILLAFPGLLFILLGLYGLGTYLLVSTA